MDSSLTDSAVGNFAVVNMDTYQVFTKGNIYFSLRRKHLKAWNLNIRRIFGARIC